MKKSILLVDDEPRIREVVEFVLEREGLEVRSASSISEAKKIFADETISAIVLDIMLPDGDGLSWCREIRALSQTPILFLSARADEIDRVLGLELGGDDYLTKPFSPRELVARVKAILRRGPMQTGLDGAANLAPLETQKRSSGPIELDLERYEARCDNRALILTRTEFAILSVLMERPGVVFSRAQLMERGYAYDNLITERTIDTHIKRIRAKFRESNIDPIATVHGVGYKLQVSEIS